MTSIPLRWVLWRQSRTKEMRLDVEAGPLVEQFAANGDFGLATSQVREAKTRHSDRKQFLNGLLSEIESVNKEEVAVSLTTLQTQLEASYQVTARLSQLSLTNYL